MAERKFNIMQSIACLSPDSKGWTKEINMVSWNDAEPKYDIRAWDATHTRMGKGVTLTREELETLKNVLNELI